MVGKPDIFILSGNSGKIAYDKICSAKPLSTPQYTKTERDNFNKTFSKRIPDIIKTWNDLSVGVVE